MRVLKFKIDGDRLNFVDDAAARDEVIRLIDEKILEVQGVVFE